MSQPEISEIEPFIAALPKAELHVHLEGSVDADTLWELAVQQSSDLAAAGREGLVSLYRTEGFSDFLQAFKTVCLHLRTPEDYELVTYRALRNLAGQNVRYTEMILSAGVMVWRGHRIEPLFLGAARGAERAARDFAIQTRWIFDVVRQFPLEDAWQVAQAAANLRDQGVVAIGLGGDEAATPEKFREVFQFVHHKGLHCVAHAGEASGPESIWSAIRSLGAERIGHGLAAIQDRSLVNHLAQTDIPVEICLTSNVRTAGVPALPQHPVRAYFDAGVPVSLHTDDPALFATTLLREYRLAHDVFGFSRDELRQLARNSFSASFLSPEKKQAFIRGI